MIHSNIFSKYYSRIEHKRWTKITVNFPKNSPLEANWQFGLELAQIYTALYLMIYSNIFSTCCRLMGHRS